MALHRFLPLVLMLFVPLPLGASAQTAQTPSTAPSAQAPSTAPSSDQMLKPEELDALVAPIALYPDSLLSLMLMASTYPLEVVTADRWVRANKKLKGDALKSEVDKQAWDESVKSLSASPDVLSMMSSKLDWTTKLGDAVLAQQPDVMDAIQRMRARADANNKLTSTKEQRVTKTQSQGGKQVIAIEQTNPDTLYVPYYDPAVVYGGWPYPAYPPYYFGYPGYIGAGIIATGLAFGAGWALGRWGAGGNYWGGAINWNGNINNININRPKVNPLGGNNFQHRLEHRQGVRYNNSNVRQQFGNNNRGGVQNRVDFRGRGGNQVLRPGGGPGGAQSDLAGGQMRGSGHLNGRARVNGLRNGRAQDNGPRNGRAAAMRSATSVRAEPPVSSLRGVAPALAVVVVASAVVASAAVAVAVSAAVAVAASAVVAAAAGARISDSSTISFCSATCRTALATIGSATMAATALTWA